MNSELRLIQAIVHDLECRSFDRLEGRCPRCGYRELRVFDTDPVEWRCAHCCIEGFGAEEFLEKLGKPRFGVCRVCGERFKIPAYIRRKKEYCSATCRKRAERQRKRARESKGDFSEKTANLGTSRGSFKNSEAPRRTS